jgi:hypothetical protein
MITGRIRFDIILPKLLKGSNKPSKKTPVTGIERTVKNSIAYLNRFNPPDQP